MTLEDEIRKAMEQATERDLIVLAARTGLGPKEVSTQKEIDLCYRLIGAQKAAILRLAREIDEIKGA